MKVYTNIKTLAKVERLFKGLGLLGLLYGDTEQAIGLEDVLTKLIHEHKLAELMQIITRDSGTDFEEMELKELREILSDFFIGIVDFFPGVIQANLRKLFSGAESSTTGKAFI